MVLLAKVCEVLYQNLCNFLQGYISLEQRIQKLKTNHKISKLGLKMNDEDIKILAKEIQGDNEENEKAIKQWFIENIKLEIEKVTISFTVTVTDTEKVILLFKVKFI